jgi:hypothetical protein
MTHTHPAGDSAPVPIRVDDRITLADNRPLEYVHSLHRDLKNGRPGVRYRAAVNKRMHWTYLTDILTVNGQRTDYALRYPIPAEPHWATDDRAVLARPAHEQKR